MAKTDLSIKAKQFNPQEIPWPKEVISWDEETMRPKDCSWGYVECKNGKVHILAGDWIITIGKNKYICKEKEFPALKKRFKETFKREWKKASKKDI